MIYDCVLTSNTIAIFYTQSADLESFYKQGWCISVNRQNGTLNIHNAYGTNTTGIDTTLPSIYKSVSFVDNFGSYANVRVELCRDDRNIVARLYDGMTLNLIAQVSSDYERSIVPVYGLGYDYPAVTITQGKIYLSKLTLLAPYSDKCYLYIVGDSITEGVPVKQKDAWAYKVASIVPNTVISGRGGGGMPGVLAKLNSEVEELKPKFVMVTVGTNDYDTVSNLPTLVTNIKDKGAIPIINCVPCYPAGTSTAIKLKTTINNAILALGEKCVRFDIATSLNYALQEPDESLYVSDKIHPNEAGHLRMFTRVQIDMPELFNF